MPENGHLHKAIHNLTGSNLPIRICMDDFAVAVAVAFAIGTTASDVAINCRSVFTLCLSTALTSAEEQNATAY